MAIETTYDLINDGNIIPAVHNFYNWTELFRHAPTFTAFNNLGMLQVAAEPTGGKGKGNYRVDFNKLTGMKTKYEVTANILDVSGDIDLKTVGNTSVINPATGLSLLNITPRVGLGLRFVGTATNDELVKRPINVLFRLNTVTSSTSWTVELLQSNVLGVTNADTFDTIDAGSYCYITDIADFGGTAPTADDMATSQDFNYLQMYDIAYGKDLVAMSQNAKFSNTNAETALAVQARLFNSINTDIWFGLLNAATGSPGNAPRDGYNYGTMAGMWGLLGLADTSANTDPSKVVAQVDTGTSIDFDKLELAVSSRTYGSDNLVAFGSRKMSAYLAQAARRAGETVRTETVQFPRCAIQKRVIPVGDVTLNFISDDTLLHHPVFSDGTNTAGQGLMFVAFDSSKAGLFYHDNKKLGLMVPKTEPVFNARNQRTEEYHMLTALTCGAWDKSAHFAYGITGS
jgi:hypothetical protein